MQKIKKIFINLVAVVIGLLTMLSFTACEDIKKLELNIDVWDYADNGAMKEYTLDIDLYRHLAPETVDSIVDYVNEGYYNNTFFYKMSDFNSQIMVGDLVANSDNKYVQNAVKPEIKGEFDRNGTVGSNLVNKKGSVGLWRSWYECDSFSTTSDAMNSGRSTMFIPTDSLGSYDKYFCVFGQYDAKDTDNKALFDAINKAFESANYEEFEIYYTGTYDEAKANENYGLEFHIVEKDKFIESDVENLFKAEGAQLDSYNHYTVKIPLTSSNKVAVKITSAKIA